MYNTLVAGVQVVSSTNGELQGDDQVGGQSNAPITAPADVDNTETTKYVFCHLCVFVTVSAEHIPVTLCMNACGKMWFPARSVSLTTQKVGEKFHPVGVTY